MKYPYRFKLLLSLLLLFAGTMAFAQTSKDVIVRTGQGPAAPFVGDAHNEGLKQMLEKHKEAVKRRQALNAEKTARAAKAALARRSRLTKLAASITVTSTNNEDAVDANSSPVTASGDTTLRSAIEYAGVVTVDTIFVPAGTYSLDPALGQLNVEQFMVIKGAGAGSTIINGGHNWYRVFEIDNGPVTIADLTVTQGYMQGDNGGGILVNAGPVELDSVDLTNNQAQVNGGGVAIEGIGVSVTAKYCTFSYDSTTVYSWGYGGGICNDSGNLTVDQCTFRHNYGDGASGAIYITAGNNVISNCVIDSNYSLHGTGGVTGAVGSTTMTLTNDTVRWNYGGGSGLGVSFTMRSCVFNYNTSGSAGGVSMGAA
ncbi:MAG TPA: right-handed parallel beta-helix repeat-containing protein, partial [Candidatus Kryptobacter bacterium]|nr:right-handed parallel beta-helix repeat-containing protein [Candidatus Kryptobacter bacterium]